jgi:hypothetical protein
MPNPGGTVDKYDLSRTVRSGIMTADFSSHSEEEIDRLKQQHLWAVNGRLGNAHGASSSVALSGPARALRAVSLRACGVIKGS